jgi:cytochrome b6-f complex iron-sulfur subunit
MTTDEGRLEHNTGAPAIVARPAAIAARRQRTAAQADLMTRRSLLRSGFWAGLGVTGAGLLLGFVNYAWPRKVARAGGVFLIPATEVPSPGADPTYVQSGKFYLVNLRPGDGVPAVFADLAEPAQRGGLLALAQKCPHLGCSIPWRPDFSASETRGVTGWFRCPCHMSTYSTAGVRVHGPAPRSMDLFAVRVRPNGSVEVDTTRVTPGSTENPQRAALA